MPYLLMSAEKEEKSMRKAQKQQADDFMKLLGQAHEEIKRSIEKKNIQTALNLLADCQEGAISLGNLIEKTEGKDTAVIPLLEEYCELLYQIHEELSGREYALKNLPQAETFQEGDGQSVLIPKGQADKGGKQLRRLFVSITNSIHQIKVRREVVFLPYKASMWDSLESVWKAADEDPDCDAYVIPIPYFDRNPDGTFREMHYEGGLYPKYVPVTRYEDYDFETRRPDIIFIHNPYDNTNFVTSVHPFFYSTNLKKYTEQLVYIPYFILEEIEPEDQKAVDKMKHFCTVPGVIAADRVIVQSEKMRQVYINVLTEFLADRGMRRKYWEKKILGLGSPKIAKVLATRREDLEIPKEWKKIIQKPDGSWKKIIFYNTSVGALLEHGQKMLEKMRCTFRILKKDREKVALLWRPHPLLQATVESMRPQIREEYREIVEQYQEEGWGIYDDSADMNRAVALSDAYYGDWSSIVHLYQKTGKPVMIQDVGVLR